MKNCHTDLWAPLVWMKWNSAVRFGPKQINRWIVYKEKNLFLYLIFKVERQLVREVGDHSIHCKPHQDLLVHIIIPNKLFNEEYWCVSCLQCKSCKSKIKQQNVYIKTHSVKRLGVLVLKWTSSHLENK